MDKFDWKLMEQWATNKAIRFGLPDDWIDFVMWVVNRRIEEDRKRDDSC